MPALEGKIKIPLIGEVGKKPALIGGAAFAAFIGFMYIRHRNNATTTNANPAGGTAAGAAGDTGTVTDPAGNVCSALSSSGSGYCPGTEEDIAYSNEAGGLGYNSTGALGSDLGFGGGTGYNPVSGLYTDPNGVSCANPLPSGYCPTNTTTGGGNPGPGTYANNEQWLEAAEQAMPGTDLTVAAAKIFAGIAVTANQKDTFLEAAGLIGPPPNGYPTIHTTDTKGHPGSQGKVAVPVVTGERRITATAKLRAAGLSPEVVVKTKVPPGKEAVVIDTNPNGGTQVSKGSKVTVNVGPR